MPRETGLIAQCARGDSTPNAAPLAGKQRRDAADVGARGEESLSVRSRAALGAPSPEGADPVDALDRLADSMLTAIVLDRRAAVIEPVVVDDQEPARLEARIEVAETVHRGLIE